MTCIESILSTSRCHILVTKHKETNTMEQEGNPLSLLHSSAMFFFFFFLRCHFHSALRKNIIPFYRIIQ